MAATKVGIVYGTVSGIPRRVIKPDSDAQLDNRFVGTGETLLIVTNAEYAGMKSLADLVNQKTGLTPADPRCAVVDAISNKVTDIVLADPLVDSLAGKIIVASPTAQIGQTYNPLTKTIG